MTPSQPQPKTDTAPSSFAAAHGSAATVCISLDDARRIMDFADHCKADQFAWRLAMPAIDRLEDAIKRSPNTQAQRPAQDNAR